MNILIIGAGGREHAIARCVKNSESCKKLYCIPGNPGIEDWAECYAINAKQVNLLLEFCTKNAISLVIIGPEQPIAEGLSDILRSHGVNVFAPSQAAARLETSKSFAKSFMQKYGIPTARFATFEKSQIHEAENYISNLIPPIVIKADGLAAGKGVIIAENIDEAVLQMKKYLSGMLGKASEKIVIEEFMQGEEASIFAICDGNDFVTLAAAQDHKRIGNGDTGKNTGGMGAYAPASLINENILIKIQNEIIIPTLNGMKQEGYPFTGCLYVGLMIYKNEPKVVEYNVRFGDPETQAVLSIFDGDLAKLLYSASIGKLDKSAINSVANGNACCVILASEGYPDVFSTGYKIEGDLGEKDGVVVFHSGTKKNDNGDIVTSGGRVLGVTAVSSDIISAVGKAYQKVGEIGFENKYYRTDIANKEIRNFYISDN